MKFELRRSLTQIKANVYPVLISLKSWDFAWRIVFCSILGMYAYKYWKSGAGISERVKIDPDSKTQYSKTLGLEKDLDSTLKSSRQKDEQQ